ncbi:MAG: glycosyltransferase family 39 protein [Desulfobacteraceae bacterium]|nr:glycosyltransferase family 39 protein [Desulfobacteraceae bacterium]
MHNYSGYSAPTGCFGRWPALLSAALIYFMAGTLLTWPVLFKPGSVLFGNGDTRGVVWGLWAKTNGFLDAPVNHLIAAPFGAPANPDFSQPVADWLSGLLARLFNEVAGFNLFVFLSFPLTAIAAYFLLERLLRNKTAAFFGGLVFGFCPAAVMQAAGGHTYSFNVFIPLFLLALFYNRTRRTLLSTFYVGASFALVTLTALYFGYLAIYVGLFFLVFDILNSKGEDSRAIFLNYLYGAFFAAAMVLPFEYRVIYQQITWGGAALAEAGHIRAFNELAVYSSRPWDYLIPSIDHPVLGVYFKNFARSHLHGSNLFEQTLYLGMVPIGLLITGMILAARGKFNETHRTYFLFFAFGALWMFFLSLPPLISLHGVKVPTVSYFAYHIAPMFRVYARFGILVDFFVACAAAVVLTHLYQHMKRIRYYAMLAFLLPLLVFEYWSVPPDYARAVDRPPEVYQWLAKQPGDFIIAEYPMTPNDAFSFYTYLFWQRIHKKKLVNGAGPDNAKAWAFFEKVKDLANPETPALLKSVGVKYVIVHQEMYKEGPISVAMKRFSPPFVSSMTYNGGNAPTIPFPMKLYKKFGADMVFSLGRKGASTGTLRQSRTPAG